MKKIYYPAGLATSAAVFLLVAGQASAITIKNQDDLDHKITIIENDKKTDHTLQPMQTLKDICMAGCIVRLDDNPDENEDYQLEGTEVVIIEDGFLYHDGPEPPQTAPQPPPEVPAAPASPGTPPPAKKL